MEAPRGVFAFAAVREPGRDGRGLLARCSRGDYDDTELLQLFYCFVFLDFACRR